MEITHVKAIGRLVNVYTTSTSTVLLCEAKKKVDVQYWEIYLNGEFYKEGWNADVALNINQLYFRLNDLDRDTVYTVYVKAVNGSGEHSLASNVISFKTVAK